MKPISKWPAEKRREYILWYIIDLIKDEVECVTSVNEFEIIHECGFFFKDPKMTPCKYYNNSLTVNLVNFGFIKTKEPKKKLQYVMIRFDKKSYLFNISAYANDLSNHLKEKKFLFELAEKYPKFKLFYYSNFDIIENSFK